MKYFKLFAIKLFTIDSRKIDCISLKDMHTPVSEAWAKQKSHCTFFFSIIECKALFIVNTQYYTSLRCTTQILYYCMLLSI